MKMASLGSSKFSGLLLSNISASKQDIIQRLNLRCMCKEIVQIPEEFLKI